MPDVAKMALVTPQPFYRDFMSLPLLLGGVGYLGSGVMAFFGAPKYVENHAVNCCNAALVCQQQTAELNQKWKDYGLDFAFNTRIGIHTGEVVIGNIGSDARMNYTIIGDNVNLASRIESTNKFYATRILITETTYQEVKDYFVTRFIDNVIVTGRASPIKLYELIGSKSAITDEKLQLIERYHSAFELYSKRKFTEAVVILEELISNTPSDHVPQLLLGRCLDYLANPPALDWQGDYILPYK
jgi:adenylate cyclase